MSGRDVRSLLNDYMKVLAVLNWHFNGGETLAII